MKTILKLAIVSLIFTSCSNMTPAERQAWGNLGRSIVGSTTDIVVKQLADHGYAK